ncbi:MAG: cwlS [Bacteroidetes bacterium]|jgi:LysM repeat protein/ABC-type branched-subunit amino acid transport system substrate-binding protein|nr:cwlS [Bacteroidota bacterium]
MYVFRIASILCFTALYLAVVPACSQTAIRSTVVQTINGKKYYIHKVEKGQSLYAISKIYETDLNTIVIDNPDAIDGIKPGQELKIPFVKEQNSSTSPADFEKYQLHKVLKNETVYSICKKYSISEKTFYEWNPEATSGLREFQLVKVGLKQNELTVAESFENYTVEKGETVYAITKKFNINIDDFYNLNPETRSGVSTGQIVKIRKKNNAVTVTTTTTTTTSVVPLVMDTVMKSKKDAYKIGLFLPFEFNETEQLSADQLIKEKKDFPEMQTIAVDFYEGVKYAMDSLQNKGAKYSIQLFDTQDKDSMQVDKLIKQLPFTDIDLIIGPMFNSTFKVVSEKAREKNIPIVSPVTQQNKILFNNPYSSKTTPSNITLLEALAEFVADSFRTQNIVIINSGKPKEQSFVKTFKTHYNEYLALTYNNTKDTVNEVKGYPPAKAAYTSAKKNYFVILSEDEVFLTDVLTQLNSFIDKKKELNVIGMKKWITIDHLDPEYLNKFNFTFAAANYVCYSKPEISQAAKAYRTKYYIDPSDFYFQGIDIGLYYMNALKEYGPDFYKKLDANKKKGIIMDFNFFRPSETTGFDNKSIQIIRYSDYTFSKVN